MRNDILKKGLVLGIIILFFGSGVALGVSGKPSPLFIDRDYFFGSIYNLTINEGEKHYVFLSHNVREFGIFIYSIRTWGISYAHWTGNIGFSFVGFNFRGILTHTFICGYFYLS